MEHDVLTNYQMMKCRSCGCVDGLRMYGDTLKCGYCGAEYTKKEAEKLIIELKDNKQESMYLRAKQFEDFGDEENARSCYGKLANEFPYDYRGWYGLMRLMDWKKWFYIAADKTDKMPDCFKRAVATSEGSTQLEIQKYYAVQYDKYNKNAEAEYKEYSEPVKALEKRKQELETSKQILAQKINGLEAESNKYYKLEYEYRQKQLKFNKWKWLFVLLLIGELVALWFCLVLLTLFGLFTLGPLCVVAIIFTIRFFFGNGSKSKKYKRQYEDINKQAAPYREELQKVSIELHNIENEKRQLDWQRENKMK